MSKIEKFNIYSYHWSYEDEDSNRGWQCIIRLFGFNEKNESVYVRIEDFLIPIYIELPEHIDWNEGSLRAVCVELQNLNKKKEYKPVNINCEYKKKSYYAHVEKLPINEQKDGIKYKHKEFPFICLLFSSIKACDSFISLIRIKREIMIPALGGKIKLKLHCESKSLTPVLKLLGICQLPSAGWMKAKGIRFSSSAKESTRKHEYAVSYQDIKPMSEVESVKMPVVLPKVLSFDNEAYSSIGSSMPKANRPADVTFQIGVTILDPPKNNQPKIIKKFLLSLGKPDLIEGVDSVLSFKTEADLYIGLTNLIKEEDPEVIIGYNILRFDIPYIIERCEDMLNCLGEFDMFGCIEGKHAKKEEISWSSSAYGKQEFSFLSAEGRLIIDLFPCVQRNFKLPNYRLETVCDEFLKTNKDPLKPKDIFRCYKEFSPKSLALVGKYCVQDSYVVMLLYEKLLIWADLTESATVNSVPIIYMYTKGQQIKLYSQLFKYTFHNNYIMESNAYTAKDNEKYEGAYVSEPIKGLYDSVIPFDFCSLYPSIMMGYNIDYSKLVLDSKIPDEDCEVMVWSRHECCKCPKDTNLDKKERKDKEGNKIKVCANYKYRWLKHQVSGRGILPMLLKNALAARKNTRKQIAVNEIEIKLLTKIITKENFLEENEKEFIDMMRSYKESGQKNPALDLVRLRKVQEIMEFPKEKADIISERIEFLKLVNVVLDQRQKAFKVNANSMYGACGAKQGYAPFLPAAMSVTYMGRTNILKVNKFIETECGGKVIYNDTDSAYCYFPQFDGKPYHELWKYAKQIVQDVKKLFPEEVSLEFEEKIYKQFLILTKKRYAAKYINEEGKLSSSLMKRGIILQRRDNSAVLRKTYEELLLKVFDYHAIFVKLDKNDKKSVLQCAQVQDCLNLVLSGINDLFQWKYNFRSFTITKQMTKMITEYKNQSRIPTHALLGEKMRLRGVPITAGSRIEYIICNNTNGSFKKTESQKEKVEDINYFAEYREIYRVSYLNYLKQFITPIDEVLYVVLGIKDFVKQQFDIRINYNKTILRIKQIFSPKIEYIEDENIEIVVPASGRFLV